MKLFPHAHAAHPQWRVAAARVLEQLHTQMAGTQHASTPGLGLLYITDHYAPEAEALLDFLAAGLPTVTDWCGTVGVGVAGNGVEHFDEPGLSVMLCDIPRAQYRLFSGIAPLQRDGHALFAAHTALVHADGHMPDLAELIAELADRTHSGYLFGGLSASRTRSVQFARSGAEAGVFDGGLSGVAFAREVGLVSRLTQGCQPLGEQKVITSAQDNLVLTLGGRPALDVLLDTLGVSLDGDPQPALQAVRATLAGLVDPGTPHARRTGHFGVEVRVRHIVGLDATRRGVALDERVAPGMQLAFCQRHTVAARADLMRICAEIREELAPQLEAVPAQEMAGEPAHERRIVGAVYVSCSGRGGPYFGGPHAELQIVRHALGDVPLTGFFAGGEIAAHCLYGYTGVLTVFMGAPA